MFVREKKENRTGIPTQLKERFEEKTGFTMDDVKVHYHSDKPAQLLALAYTKGNDVYVGPGQEKYLEHELGHVIQQKQGRVTADGHIGNIPVNSSPQLEQEADHFLSRAEPVHKKGLLSRQAIQRQSADMDGVAQCTRETVQGFLRSIKADPDRSKKVVLYTHVKGDGLGDAGQLGYLYETMNENQIKEAYGIGEIVTAATYEGDTCIGPKIQSSLQGSPLGGGSRLGDSPLLSVVQETDTGEEDLESETEEEGLPQGEAMPLRKPGFFRNLEQIEEGRAVTIKRLAHIRNDSYLKSFSSRRSDPDARDKADREGIRDLPVGENWEIEYPFPDPNIKDDKVLQIKEMGTTKMKTKDLGYTAKAGELADGIGYGIPEFHDELELEEEWKRFFEGAWLVSVKEYAYGDGNIVGGGRSVDEGRVIAKARENGVRLVIFAGGSPKEFKCEDGIYILKANFTSSGLRKIMNSITKGMIISGGEGLFAESLGAKDADTAAVLAGRYRFQYEEIAHKLLTLNTSWGCLCTKDDFNSKKTLLETVGKYAIFYVEPLNQYVYYEIKGGLANYTDLMTGNVLGEVDKNLTLRYSKELSALYLPFSINGTGYEINRPEVITYEEARGIFARMKTQLKDFNNWFDLIRAVGRENGRQLLDESPDMHAE